MSHTKDSLSLLDRQIAEIVMKRPRGALSEYDLFRTLEVIMRVLRKLCMEKS